MPDSEARFRLPKSISKTFTTASEILFEATDELKMKYIHFGKIMKNSPNERAVSGKQGLSCSKQIITSRENLFTFLVTAQS